MKPDAEQPSRLQPRDKAGRFGRVKHALRTLTRLVVPRYAPRTAACKRVAIVVPMSNRTYLQPDEEISMRHLLYYLGRYDKFMVAPKGVALDFPGFAIKRFPRKFFGSPGAHARLLYNPKFYRAFDEYEFILFYHLDSLVFSDELEKWCAADIDYIGPPWIRCADSPWVRKNRVGNCGFALLRVQSALQVLSSRYHLHPSTYWLDMFARIGDPLKPLIPLMKTLPPRFLISRAVGRLVKEWEIMQDPGHNDRNTDFFWSDHAARIWPGFKVATLEEGLRFGFEVAPELCFEMNGARMPFGCHAWSRYDRKFWEPYLLLS